jgi:hypothetical protein
MKPKKQRYWSVCNSHGDGTGCSGGWFSDEQLIALIRDGFRETDTITLESPALKKLPKLKGSGPTGVQG